jgi:hypothetical protein
MHVEAGALVNDGIALIVRGDAMLTLWNAPARLHRSRWVFDQLDVLAAVQPGGVVGMMIILPAADPPDAATRTENFLRLRRLTGRLRRVVTVIIGDELHQTVVRTVLRLLAIPLGSGRLVVERSIDLGLIRMCEAGGRATPSHAELQEAAAALYTSLELPIPTSLRARQDASAQP